MSGQYDNPIRLQVSFEEPEPTSIVLQGPALAAYWDMMEEGSDEAYEAFMDKLTEQCESHIAQWTRIRDWDRT